METKIHNRCGWCGHDPLYIDYHDREWGVPEYDSRKLWENLMLEGFQAGLSWITILRKRSAFRDAFAGFDPVKVAKFAQDDVNRLLANTGIVRHRGKIEATISAAGLWQQIEAQQGFANYIWSYVDGRPIQNAWTSQEQLPAQTELSVQLSKDLKKRGFKFCGPTIVYSFLQASGLINDHLTSCDCYARVRASGEPMG